MSTATQSVAQSFYTVYNENKPDLLDEILADTYVGHVNGHDIVGATSAKGFIIGFLSAFPDAHYTVEDTIESGDRIVTRWGCTGTHKGAFFGVEPTNKEVTMIGITIFQVADGKIAQLWNNWDVFGLMNQLKG
ncbi:ester cyclase [Phormidesmis sp. 146-12]